MKITKLILALAIMGYAVVGMVNTRGSQGSERKIATIKS